MMKQKQWFTTAVVLLAALALSISVFAVGEARRESRLNAPGQSLVSDLESALDGIESALGSDRVSDTAQGSESPSGSDRVTDRVTSGESSVVSGSETGGMTTEQESSAVGLVVGILVALIVIILIFVILSRKGTNGTKQ